MSERRMWVHYKDAGPVAHLRLPGALRIQPKSGTRRGSQGLQMRLLDTEQGAALLWLG